MSDVRWNNVTEYYNDYERWILDFADGHYHMNPPDTGAIVYPSGKVGVVGPNQKWTDEPVAVCDTLGEAKAVGLAVWRMQ